MIANIGWDRLHDATLIAVTTDWASGVTHVRVRLSDDAARGARIKITELVLLRCPREQPWGPSVSINEVRLLSLQDGRKRLEIEIQSGDVIEIEGSTVVLTDEGLTTSSHADELEAAWSDENDGILYLIRTGIFDPAKAEAFLTTLKAVDLGTSGSLDRRVVRLLWYLPLFLNWQRERPDPEIADALAKFEARVANEVERLLGVP